MSLIVLATMACAGGPSTLPDPRPIVIRSGARLFPEKPRLEEVDDWFRLQRENIEVDPSFLIETVSRDTPAYPWESLLIVPPDTARIGVELSRSSDARTAYEFYAHYHLMDYMGRLDEWLPGSESLDEYQKERLILSRVADVWLYGRAMFQAVAYEPLEQLVYSAENGYLDAFLLTARGEEFTEERQAWLREDPEAQERFREWFLEAFEKEPPGLGETG
jgi:hypothetical protein